MTMERFLKILELKELKDLELHVNEVGGMGTKES